MSNSVRGNVENTLISNFLSIDTNRKLFIEGFILNKETSKNELRDNFNRYIFKVKFLSYIKSTIIYQAKHLRSKYLHNISHEKLCLNATPNDSFDQEIVFTIMDNSLKEFEEYIYSSEFWELLHDRKLYFYITNLSKKQKIILYYYVFYEYTEKEISKMLSISQQAVNKEKNKLFTNLRNLENLNKNLQKVD